jgi:hypothetical protein
MTLTITEARAALKAMANPEWPNYESAKQMLEAFIEQVDGVRTVARAEVEAAAETRPLSTHIDTLKALRWSFQGDIAQSLKALQRPKCKDPEWHRLRVRVRNDDIAALDVALTTLAPKALAASELFDALQLVLPMAKGYAAAHPVGSNQAHCDHADDVLHMALGGGVPAAPQTEAKPLGGN